MHDIRCAVHCVQYSPAQLTGRGASSHVRRRSVRAGLLSPLGCKRRARRRRPGSRPRPAAGRRGRGGGHTSAGGPALPPAPDRSRAAAAGSDHRHPADGRRARLAARHAARPTPGPTSARPRQRHRPVRPSPHSYTGYRPASPRHAGDEHMSAPAYIRG